MEIFHLWQFSQVISSSYKHLFRFKPHDHSISNFINFKLTHIYLGFRARRVEPYIPFYCKHNAKCYYYFNINSIQERSEISCHCNFINSKLGSVHLVTSHTSPSPASRHPASRCQQLPPHTDTSTSSGSETTDTSQHKSQYISQHLITLLWW